jgi:hypothetical protein
MRGIAVVQESDQGVEVGFSGEPSEDVQRSLMNLAKSLDGHISALHAAGCELLSRRAKAGAPSPVGSGFSVSGSGSYGSARLTCSAATA